MKRALSHLVLSIGLLSASQAEIIGYDSFDYPDGTITGANGGIFWDYKNTAPVGHTGTKSDWEIFDGPKAAFFSDGKLITDAADAKREYNGSNEAEGAVNTANVAKQVYYRVSLVTPGNVLSTVGLSSLDFDMERIFIGVPFSQDKFGIVDLLEGTTAFSTTSAQPNTAYTFVAKIDFVNDIIALFIDPDLAQPESANTPVITKSYTGSNWSTAVRLASGGTFNPTEWDDLMVATTWDDLKTRYVTNTADSGPGSLRQAISDAQPGCEIRFDPALSGSTITLTSGELLLDKSIDITGVGLAKAPAISGNQSSRIFRAISGSPSLDSLILRDGNAQGNVGGGVYVLESDLTLENCSITNCSATRGGALYSNTNLTTHKTTLINCTLSGNSAVSSGGAIRNIDGITELIHCTISGNSAPVDSGAGIDSYADSKTQTVVSHSIVSANFNGDVNLGSANGTQSFVSSNGNLIGTGTGISAFNGSSDLITSDPQLAPLADYGGPLPTMRPLSGSPAINPSSNSGVSSDQRGFARDTSPDRGAVERGPVVTVTNLGNDGPGTLRDILSAVMAPDTRIRFSPELNGQTITLTSGELSIPASTNVEIDATTLLNGITLSGNNTSRVIVSSGKLGLTRVNVVDGSAEVGGGIVSGGALLVVDSSISSNVASDAGGGVFLQAGEASFLRSTVSGNSAHQGGAIWQQGSVTSRLENCSIFGNSETSSSVGSIALLDGMMTLKHCTVTGNSGNSGLYIAPLTNVTVNHCIIAGNSNVENSHPDILLNGGTLIADGPSLIGANGTVSNEFPAGELVGTLAAPLDPKLMSPGNYGGLTQTVPAFFDSSAIGLPTGNPGSSPATDQRGVARLFGLTLGAVHEVYGGVTSTSNDGPGSLREILADEFTTNIIFDPTVFRGDLDDTIILSTPLTLTRSVGIDGTHGTDVTLSGSDATRIMTVEAGNSALLRNLNFENGSSNDGGAIRNLGDLTVEKSTFTDNQSSSNGGAISSSGNLTIRSSELSNNSASNLGGGILIGGTSAKLLAEDCLLAENQATGGGATFCFGGDSTFTNTTIANNQTSGSGGAVWIQNEGASLDLIHCTVAGNSAVAMTWDSSGNTVTVENSIIAGNGNGSENVARPPLENGNNQIGGSLYLAPLSNYGGPFRTMPPLPGSSAIEGGVLLDTTPPIDLHEVPRPQGSLPDLGAVEAVAMSLLGLASSDGDSIPDILEGPGSPYPQLSPTTDDSSLDTDRDGVTDEDEIASSTNPLDANSRLRITEFDVLEINPGLTSIFVLFDSFPGISYSVEFSENLDFTGARISTLGNATDFQSAYALILAPNEKFLRIKRTE